MIGKYNARVVILSVFAYLSLILSGFVLPAFAYDSGVAVRILLKATTMSDGRHIEYLKTEKPEVTGAIVEIVPGAETGWHLHKVPVYAYVLEGTLNIQMEDGKVFTFEKGRAIIEVLDVAHNGRNTGTETVKLMVFYTGEEGKPLSVKVQRK